MYRHINYNMRRSVHFFELISTRMNGSMCVMHLRPFFLKRVVNAKRTSIHLYQGDGSMNDNENDFPFRFSKKKKSSASIKSAIVNFAFDQVYPAQRDD